MSFSPRALRVLKAIEEYTKKYKRFDTLNVLNKVKITSARDGSMSASFTVTDDMCNMGKYLHGAFTASVIDCCSAISLIDHDKGGLAFTTDMNILYISSGNLGDIIKIEIKPIKISKARAVVECVLTNDKRNSTIAKAVVGFIFPNPPMTFEEFPYDPADNIKLASLI
ncbi:acyl-coenzyme A thioesterase 13-like [Arctopsyche grandis]|uniref:acyl-coenzyme A thioesterase 13-like n=1 Tax=Arctopsyche grandis TaxID=121162 RepID=UPI00406D76EE